MPNVDFLEGSGLELDNGIVVDDHFRTSVADVYAIGDVAHFDDGVVGRRAGSSTGARRTPRERTSGATSPASGSRSSEVSAFFTKMFDLQLQLLGDTEGVDEVVLRGSIAERNLVGFYLREERLIAAVVVGQAGDMVEELKTLVREQPLLADRSRIADRNVRPATVFARLSRSRGSRGRRSGGLGRDDPDRAVAALHARRIPARVCEPRLEDDDLLAVELGERRPEPGDAEGELPRAHLVVDRARRVRPVDPDVVVVLEVPRPGGVLFVLRVAGVARGDPFERPRQQLERAIAGACAPNSSMLTSSSSIGTEPWTRRLPVSSSASMRCQVDPRRRRRRAAPRRAGSARGGAAARRDAC